MNVIYLPTAHDTGLTCRTCDNTLNIDEADSIMLCHGCYCIIFDNTRTDYKLVKKEINANI